MAAQESVVKLSVPGGGTVEVRVLPGESSDDEKVVLHALCSREMNELLEKLKGRAAQQEIHSGLLKNGAHAVLEFWRGESTHHVKRPIRDTILSLLRSEIDSLRRSQKVASGAR